MSITNPKVLYYLIEGLNMGEYAEIKDRIKQLRLSKGWSQQTLAEKLGVTNVAVSQWERGVKQPKMEMREALCDLFNVNMEYLNGNWDKISRLLSEDEAKFLDAKRSKSDAFRTDIPIGHYRIPVLTTVAAGKPIYAEEDVLQWIDYDKEPGDHVRACRIEGNSMIPRIQNGDTVIFDSELGWEDGDVVIATVNGDHATCKRIKRYADGIALLSDNANIAPMYFSKKEVEDLPVKVIGRVTEVRGKL